MKKALRGDAYIARWL